MLVGAAENPLFDPDHPPRSFTSPGPSGLHGREGAPSPDREPRAPARASVNGSRWTKPKKELSLEKWRRRKAAGWPDIFIDELPENRRPSPGLAGHPPLDPEHLTMSTASNRDRWVHVLLGACNAARARS